jgi:hypothetical protein
MVQRVSGFPDESCILPLFSITKQLTGHRQVLLNVLSFGGNLSATVPEQNFVLLLNMTTSFLVMISEL